MSHLWCCTHTQISPSEAGCKRGLLQLWVVRELEWQSQISPPNPLYLQAVSVCTPTGPPLIHWMYTWAQRGTRCCCCVASADSVTFSWIIIPTPLLLNNQAYGLCCLATVPTTVHQGPRGWNSPSPWSPSNLMITITCSLSAAPHSRWFVSNWPVPFAWLFWLLHFSLSPLRWLHWHYRCWVSLITPLIGLEVLHASLFWGKAAVCCERQNISACFSHFKR